MAKTLRIQIIGDAKGVGPALTEAEGKLGGFQDKVKKVLQAGGIAAGAALAKGFADHVNIDAANDKLAAQLGLTEDESERAGKVAGDLYADAYGDSMEEVQAAIGAVGSTLSGVAAGSEGDLERLSQKALNLAATFDIEVSRAVSSAGILLESGLARDADHAFDLITRGMQEMPAQLREELLEASDEYSGFFADLGISGEEAFGMLAAAAESGGSIAVDKTGDALKELLIRATDMSTASVEAYEAAGLSAENMAERFLQGGGVARGALSELIEGLLSIENPTERANAAIALFGTPIEDLGVTEIPAFLSSLSSMETSLGDVGGAAEAMGDTLNNNAKTKLEAFKRQGLQTLMNFVGGVVVPGMEKFTGLVRDNLVPALAVVSTAGVALTPVLYGMAAGWVAQNTAMLIALGKFVIIAAAVAGLAAGVKHLWENNETFRTTVLAVWEAVQGAVSSAWDSIRPVLESIGAFITGSLIPWFRDDFLPVVLDVWSSVVSAVSTAWAAIQPILQTIGTFIIETLIPWFRDSLFPAVRDAFTAIVGAIQTAWDLFRPVLEAVIGFIRSTLIPIFTIFFEAVKLNFELIVAVIRDAWGLVQPIFQAVIGFIADPLIPAFQSFLGVVQDVWGAVAGVIQTGWDAAYAVISAVIAFAKEELGKVWDPFWEATDTIFGGIGGVISRALRFVGGLVSGFLGVVASIADAVGLNNIAGVLRGAADGARGWGRSSGAGNPNQAGAFLAAGGVIPFVTNGPRAIVGEGNPAFPEYVIPTDPKHKDRARMLWEQAGSRIDMFAAGGILPPLPGGRILPSSGITGIFGSGGLKLTAEAVRAAVEQLWKVQSLRGNLSDIIPGGINSVRQRVIDFIGTEGDYVDELGPGVGYQAMWAALKEQFPGARLFSSFRPGAMTATGNRSYHSMGRAIDVTPSTAIAEWIRAHHMPATKEMIYSPMGNRQIRNGRDHRYSEPTRGDHWDHVHWAMGDGAVVDRPTRALIGEKASTRPEIVTPEQLMRRIVREEAGGDITLMVDGKTLAKIVKGHFENRDSAGHAGLAVR